MGFFNNIVKSLNPVNVIKNPGRAIKNSVAAGLDPAGSLVRTGRGMQAMPTNIKDTYDPGGFIGGEPQAAPGGYTPQHTMNLSPGAQALYDQMQARTAARNAGTPYVDPTAAPAQAPLAHRVPVGAVPAQDLADGGMVEYDGDYWENKAFERKPNGKPY